MKVKKCKLFFISALLFLYFGTLHFKKSPNTVLVWKKMKKNLLCILLKIAAFGTKNIHSALHFPKNPYCNDAIFLPRISLINFDKLHSLQLNCNKKIMNA